ncbi:MAG TPA: putative quinol monooxygenase [Acidimicrobiales bacterium]|nr:putative quinol monooxygenase [Acidimicrobiales bacterium]
MSPSESQMTVIGRLVVDPAERAEWLRHAGPLVRLTRQEPGVIDYAVGADVVDGGTIIFYERYRYPAAVDEHRNADHFKRFVQEVSHIKVLDGPILASFLEGDPHDIGPNAIGD